MSWTMILLFGGAYAYFPEFRRDVNKFLVSIIDWVSKFADVIRDDQRSEPVSKVRKTETELASERIAFDLFKKDFPNDPRIAMGWESLPAEIRGEYGDRGKAKLWGVDRFSVEENKKPAA